MPAACAASEAVSGGAGAIVAWAGCLTFVGGAEEDSSACPLSLFTLWCPSRRVAPLWSSLTGRVGTEMSTACKCAWLRARPS